MDPCCGSWIALPPEHVGRGTPAISGGAAFFSFGHFTVFQGFRCPRNAYFNMVMGSNPKWYTFFGHGFEPHNMQL
jgi:hypothetical protein